MKLYYVNATELIKGKEVSNVHAILARDLAHLEARCNNLFINWSIDGFNLDGYQLNNDWELSRLLIDFNPNNETKGE